MESNPIDKPITATDLREDLLSVYQGLKSGQLDRRTAVEINNTAGKIIASAKIQLEYHRLRKESPEIPFLK